uniref:UTR6 n=1 Tax=Arundo donax TaxID=35708 RepID=A0A0A9AZ12_ARUDO
MALCFAGPFPFTCKYFLSSDSTLGLQNSNRVLPVGYLIGGDICEQTQPMNRTHLFDLLKCKYEKGKHKHE